jgi:hypothetical protein
MRKITAFVIAAVFSIFFLQPKTANADTTFNFTGTCTLDCTGTVTATLVLQNYTIGNPLNNMNFVSFAYHSSVFPNITVNGGNFGGLFGQFNSLPGPANVNLIGNGFQFISGFVTNDGWCAGLSCSGDFGKNGQWSVVPLPTTLPLFATGLGALGFLSWRRKRKAAA